MNRVAIVTGSSGGIGSAVCKEFIRHGWDVVGVDISDSSLDLYRFEYADLSEVDAVSKLHDRLKDLQRVNAIVNNAAICIKKSVVETTDEEWQRTFDINVRSAFQMIRSFHHLLSLAKGSIVNVSSVHSTATTANVAAYAASKGALTSLTRAIAMEYAPDGIRCNAVLPGAVNTSMLQSGLSRLGDGKGSQDNFKSLESATPLSFIANPEQIAPTIVHLADNETSSYLTGQTITIDGGAIAKLSTE